MKQVNTRRDCSSRVGGEVLAGHFPVGRRLAQLARRARSPHLRLVIGRSAPPPLAKDDSRADHVQVHRPRSVTAAMADPDHLPLGGTVLPGGDGHYLSIWSELAQGRAGAEERQQEGAESGGDVFWAAGAELPRRLSWLAAGEAGAAAAAGVARRLDGWQVPQAGQSRGRSFLRHRASLCACIAAASSRPRVSSSSSSSIGSDRVLYHAALCGHGAAAPAAAPACAAGHAFSGRLSALLSPGVAAQRQWCPAATSITGLMYSRVLKPRAAARRKAARVTTAAAAVPALLASCPVFVLVLFASRAFQYEARGRRADPAQVVANCWRSV
ncbi:uncharacterized protein LOC124615618 [Schistocerca americana]|uniref:uncharacterized protein LOC124615618 n=1 Tax=Schistocerca americana TaxID=7009 RepID=UPI001F50379B|nr:uncharacterized protein LOC124615618 [Schistocerca americana]